MTAYFDNQANLWIEVTATSIPEDVKTIGTVHVYPPFMPQYSVQGQQQMIQYQIAVTYMNLTDYIHKQTLLKIMKKLDETT